MRPIEVEPDRLAEALGVALAPPGGDRRAERAHVRGFMDYLSVCAIPWRALRCERDGAVTAVSFALLPPGRTAMLLTPPLDAPDVHPDDQRAATAALLDELGSLGLYYAQALVEPADAARRSLLVEAGFWWLAGLRYLERDPTYPWSEPPEPGEAEWVPFSEDRYPEFAATIQASYRESADCPALTDLRPVGDVMAGHKASGRFDADHWQLARIGGRAAGCLLLASLTHAPVFEVVYMGVHPDFRRRGVGSLLLRRGLELSRRAGARKLTLVVDEANAPAQGLYDRFDFSTIARRDAYLRQWEAKPAIESPIQAPRAESPLGSAPVDNPLR